MPNNNWFTCEEFNAKTQANHEKYLQRKKAELRYLRRKAAAARRADRLMALDLTLAATAMLALGILIGLVL